MSDYASIYFLGASATGKTTLAKYVEENYGIHRLGSASREVFDRYYSKQYADYAALIADKRAYYAFQRDVCGVQIMSEDAARGIHKRFVSDRSFDHVVYSAMYGTRCNEIATSDEMCDYVGELASGKHNPIVFFCRPNAYIRDAAIKDGDRGNFLDWNDMMRFDGACLFILESMGIPYTQIGSTSGYTAVPVVDGRQSIVDERLAKAGLKKVAK